jgi:hypothetical protein
LYTLDCQSKTGLDLSTPEPVEETFEILSGLVGRLDIHRLALFLLMKLY